MMKFIMPLGSGESLQKIYIFTYNCAIKTSFSHSVFLIDSLVCFIMAFYEI